MKKSIIAVVIILIIIAVLPIAGNQFIKSNIDDKVAQLQSYGIEVKEDKSISSYLNTSRHFEFYLKDSTKFINYLNKYSENQIPPYVNAIINGLVIGADIKYSNLPFAKSHSIEMYPLELSPEIVNSLKKNNVDFYNYLDGFLQSKGILYHINYNLINEKFDGYIKDINMSYTLKNQAKLNLVFEKVTFKGKGELLAPSRLKSKAKKVTLSVVEANERVEMYLNGFSSSSNFESQNTYVSSADIKNMQLVMVGIKDDINMTVDNVRLNATSNDQGETTEVSSKTSVTFMSVASHLFSVEMKNFNMDVAINGIDKVLFEKLRTVKDPQQVEQTTMELFSKGLAFNIADFSVEKISTDKLGDLGGFAIKSDAKLKADPMLSQKVKQNPMSIISNIELKTKLLLSKKMFESAMKSNPVASRVRSYAKEQNDDYIFDVSFIDTKATINGQALN